MFIVPECTVIDKTKEVVCSECYVNVRIVNFSAWTMYLTATVRTLDRECACGKQRKPSTAVHPSIGRGNTRDCPSVYVVVFLSLA